MKSAIVLSGRRTLMLSVLGNAYAAAGRLSEAGSILEELHELSRQQEVPAFYFAIVYVALGEKERTIEALQQAYAERFGLLVFLKVEPMWDPLRSDPRFQDLVRRMNFPG